MLRLNFKDGNSKTYATHLVKSDDMGVAFVDPETSLPTKIFYSKLTSFTLSVPVTPAIESKSIEYQEFYSSKGPMAKAPYRERGN
jgi:hypothetical protein